MKKLFSWKHSNTSLNLGLLFLRLTVAGLMIPIGYDKLTHFATMSNMFADPFGIGKTASLALVVFAEFFCACLIVLGLMTRLATIPLIITMAVIIFNVNHGQLTGQITEHNYTRDVVVPVFYAIGFITILFTGPGRISLDATISK